MAKSSVILNNILRLVSACNYICAILVAYNLKIVSGLCIQNDEFTSHFTFSYLAPLMVLTQLDIPIIGSMYGVIFIGIFCMIINDYIIKKMKIKETMVFISSFIFLCVINYILIFYSVLYTMGSSKGNVLFVVNLPAVICWLVIAFSNVYFYFYWFLKLKNRVN